MSRREWHRHVPRAGRVGPLEGTAGLDRAVEVNEVSLLRPSVDLPAMADQVNHNQPFGVKNLVHNAKVTNSQLVQANQIAAEGIWFDCVQVGRKPLNTLHNATRDLLVKLCEFARSRVLDADLVHGYSSPNSRARSSIGWPYCPLTTASL